MMRMIVVISHSYVVAYSSTYVLPSGHCYINQERYLTFSSSSRLELIPLLIQKLVTIHIPEYMQNLLLMTL